MKPYFFLIAAAISAMPLSAKAGDTPSAFDIAEDLSRFVFAAEPVFDDSMPAFGNAFVIQGNRHAFPGGWQCAELLHGP